jgi:hypothetical protein
MCDDKKYNQVVRWRRTHSEVVRRYNQEYYERNKERLRQKRRERYQMTKKSALPKEKAKEVEPFFFVNCGSRLEAGGKSRLCEYQPVTTSNKVHCCCCDPSMSILLFVVFQRPSIKILSVK